MMSQIIKRVIYSKFVYVILVLFFQLIFDKKYLKSYYFTSKRMGFYWCFRSISNRLWGDNRKIPWPVNPRSIVSNCQNIKFDLDDLHVFQVPGCYFQNHDGQIIIGKGCYIAPNVGLITTNHDICCINKHVEGKDIILGKECWIGMNSVILPGVTLGDHTIVAAGAVVNKSFHDGYCVIGGVPAKILKKLDPNDSKDFQK